MIKILGQAALTAILVSVMLFVTGLVGNQSASDDLAGTRFPNGLSADGTEPSAGEVRGTTLTVTGDTSFESGLLALEKSEAVTGANTLTASESGTTFYWTTSGGTTTLPAVATATGTVYRFVVGSALATTNAQISSAEGDNIEGSMIVAGAVVDCDAVDRIYVLIDGENIGDFVELRSNGQKWYVTQSNALTSGKLLCDG